MERRESYQTQPISGRWSRLFKLLKIEHKSIYIKCVNLRTCLPLGQMELSNLSPLSSIITYQKTDCKCVSKYIVAILPVRKHSW